MNLSLEELFKNSYCLTISEEKYKQFAERLRKALGNETPVPKKILGIKSSEINLKKTFGQSFDREDVASMKSIFVTAEHYFLVRMAKEIDLPFVTIFEDDAVPHKKLAEKFSYYLSNLPDDLDCLRLGYTRTIDRFQKEKPISIDERFMQRNVFGSHSYVVFKKYYDAFLKKDDPTLIIDDARINPISGGKIYLTKEPLFIQYDLAGSKDKIHGIKGNSYYDRFSNEIDPSNYIQV